MDRTYFKVCGFFSRRRWMNSIKFHIVRGLLLEGIAYLGGVGI
jgi:hypothetical protein